MSVSQEPYGAQLYTELRKLGGYDLIVNNFTYEAIQQMKTADRAQTLRLPDQRNAELIQEIQAKEPTDVARYLFAKAQFAQQNSQRKQVHYWWFMTGLSAGCLLMSIIHGWFEKSFPWRESLNWFMLLTMFGSWTINPKRRRLRLSVVMFSIILLCVVIAEFIFAAMAR